MKKIIFSLLVVLTACSRATLTDSSSNDIVITVSQGEFPDRVKISWIKTPFYSKYRVLRSDTTDGLFSPISPDADIAEFFDTSVVIGKEYYYKVEGYNSLGVPLFVTGTVAGYAGTIGGFFPPSNVKASQGASSRSIVLTWDRVEDAAYYEVSRATDPEFNDIKIIADNVPYLTYNDTAVSRGATYYYQVTSYDADGVPSADRSTTAMGATYGGNVQLESQAGKYDNKIELTWKEVPYTQYYSIYRAESRYSQGTLIKEILAKDLVKRNGVVVYEDTTAEPNKSYYYQLNFGHNEAQQVSVKVRSYLKVASQPPAPNNFVVSQGVDPNGVILSWDPVSGATGYEIERQKVENGNVSWELISPDGFTATTYTDTPPNSQYSFLYRVTAVNPAPGVASAEKEGWANKPPVNITTSKAFGAKVEIAWDPVPNAVSYTIFVSEDGVSFTSLATVNATASGRLLYEHRPNIGNEQEKSFHYQLTVNTAAGSSKRSDAVEGIIKKIAAPVDVKLRDEKTPTKTITLTWDRVPDARKYIIYVATLAHRGVSASYSPAAYEYKKIGESQNAAFAVSFGSSIPLYPIRRHIFMIKAQDGAGATGVGYITPVTWRLPSDLVDFGRDVDISIMEAQKRIGSFGNDGSGGTVQGRAGGSYEYKAALSGSKNNWIHFSSFEIVLNGNVPVSVNAGSMAATLNGTMSVYGLYSGTVTYKNLAALNGGLVFSGSIVMSYNGQSAEWNTAEAGGNLDSVVLQSGESPKPYPTFDPGVGK